MQTSLSERYDAIMDGEFRSTPETFDVTDPATNEPIASVAKCGPETVDAAVTAAADATDEWEGVDPVRRGQLLDDIAGLIRENVDRYARIETAETGRPISQSRGNVRDAAGYFEYYAGLTDKIEGETIPLPGERLDYTLREPLGVTGHIVPWNAALVLGARSLGPALACGNTAVVKPAPEAPLSLLTFCADLLELDVPDGVVNVIPGDGETTGTTLTGDPRLGKIIFTGSRTTGTAVMRAAAENVVPVGLELGGKSPSIVFPDADLEAALEDTVKVFFNSGQICFATTRVFVHEDVYGEFVDDLAERTAALEVGPGAEDPDVGPLVSPDARRRVADSVEAAIEDGARAVAGGEIPREEGNFYAPTVIEGVGDDHDLSRTELFGPVLSVYSFAEEAEVIERANDTDYGLYGAIWTQTLDRAHRVAADLDAGSITVNEYPATFPQAPFGGYKQSGIGREKGRQAIREYTELKNVSIALGDTPGAVFEK
jgi:acyl-CoA reductase-like NAD-dependent aldehyde dehydrogenase